MGRISEIPYPDIDHPLHLGDSSRGSLEIAIPLSAPIQRWLSVPLTDLQDVHIRKIPVLRSAL